MKNLSDLPVLSVFAAAAAVFGIHLGESAIAEIDPVHFRGPAVHPAQRGAAIDPNDIADEPQQPRFASLYGWEEGNAARAADCVDCDALAARDAYYEEDLYYEAEPYAPSETLEMAAAYLDEAEEKWLRRGMGEWEEEHWSEEEASDHETIERYAYYPVTAEDADEEGGSVIIYSDSSSGF